MKKCWRNKALRLWINMQLHRVENCRTIYLFRIVDIVCHRTAETQKPLRSAFQWHFKFIPLFFPVSSWEIKVHPVWKVDSAITCRYGRSRNQYPKWAAYHILKSVKNHNQY